MDTVVFPVTRSFDVFDELSEEELSLILQELFNKIDVPFRRSETVPKTIFVDFFGTPNAGKTATTEKVEQLFRRNKFNTFCPPETAEISEVRSKTGPNPLVAQAQHLIGVEDYVLNHAFHPRFHAVIISRGLIDMLFWYERGVRHKEYSEVHRESIQNQVYDLLRQDLVDSFIFFTCDVEEALKREYAKAVTQQRGSKMNEKFLAEAFDCYRAVFEDLNIHVPNLPIFHIDTTGLDIKEVTQEVARCLLPTLWNRFEVSIEKILTKSLSLLRKEAARTPYFEEQLKLWGQPHGGKLDRDPEWKYIRTSEQTDTYLRLESDPGAVLRIRKENGVYKFMYKGRAEDRLLSHRRPFSAEVSEEEAREVISKYSVIAEIRKTRSNYQLGEEGNGKFFTMHIDNFGDAGVYTEIRARGTSDVTHTCELMDLAHKLGFNLRNVVEGSYLDLALAHKL